MRVCLCLCRCRVVITQMQALHRHKHGCPYQTHFQWPITSSYAACVCALLQGGDHADASTAKALCQAGL